MERYASVHDVGRILNPILVDGQVLGGFAHGFAVTKGPALVSYKVDAPYAPEAELPLKWDDPEVGIDWPRGLWPTSGPVLSEGDRSGIRLSEFEDGVLPRYDAT